MTSENEPAPSVDPAPVAEESVVPPGTPAPPPPGASLPAAVLLTSALFLAGIQLPLVLLFVSIPLLRLGLRRGQAVQAAGAAFSLAATAAALLVLAGDADAAGLSVALFAATVLLPARLGLRGVVSGWGIGRTLVAILAAEVSAMALAAIHLTRNAGISIAGEVFSMFDETRRQMLATMASAGVPAGTIAEYDKTLRMAGDFWSRRYVWLAVVALGIGFAVVLALVPRLSGRPQDPSVLNFRFEEFRNPFLLVLGFILGGVGAVFGAGVVRFLSTNLLLSVVFLCFLQGFSVVYAFLARIPVGRWFRWLVYILMVQFPVSLAVAGIGLFDEFFEFRRYRP